MSNLEEISSTTQSDATQSDQAKHDKTVQEAVTELKSATQTLYSAISSLTSSTGNYAKGKAHEGKDTIAQAGDSVEEKISEKPLFYLGIAFAAGWLGSRISR